MLALLTWTIYAGGLYVLWSAGFRATYGRWPMAYSLPPRDRYTWIDMGLSAAMWAYFAWCVWHAWPELQRLNAANSPAIPLVINPWQWLGLGLVAIGAALRVWTLIVLGPNWRMGQDTTDTKHEFVKAGPYRLMNHPINTAMVLVALGQVAITVGAWAAWALLAVTIAYHLLQGAAEIAFWNARNRA